MANAWQDTRRSYFEVVLYTISIEPAHCARSTSHMLYIRVPIPKESKHKSQQPPGCYRLARGGSRTHMSGQMQTRLLEPTPQPRLQGSSRLEGGRAQSRVGAGSGSASGHERWAGRGRRIQLQSCGEVGDPALQTDVDGIHGRVGLVVWSRGQWGWDVRGPTPRGSSGQGQRAHRQCSRQVLGPVGHRDM